jgi:hypothetical protein
MRKLSAGTRRLKLIYLVAELIKLLTTFIVVQCGAKEDSILLPLQPTRERLQTKTKNSRKV